MSTQTLPGLEAKYIFQILVKFTYFKSSNDVLSVPSEQERWKVQFPEPFFVGNFIKPVNKLCSPSLNFFNTGGHILQGRVPDRTAILQVWANKRFIQKYKGLLVKIFEGVTNKGQTSARNLNF